ncbi:hypothetical protein BRADI_3g29826v3 [Brachypodium distachyon]|uniref:RING-type E3 ubiquitin transferase n=1 Tax=Brachypodium distachyon TaxID=15368 RepID=A0A2K2D024_BRADI|nr:hypothetical protein BRADI_3g29826v3 [Brachypodium distachyon]
MAAGSQEHESPYMTRAVSRMTNFVLTEAPEAPWTRDLLAVRIRYDASICCECHFTGGRFQPASLAEEKEVVDLFEGEALRSEAACRAAVRRVLSGLSELAEYYGYRDADGGDAFVPPGLVDQILAAAADIAAYDDAPPSISYLCDVSMTVDVTNVYSEAKALLLSCSRAAGGPGRRDVGEELCPICMEELGADDVTSLPGCNHPFHTGCILEWFHMAPTCPCCRGDMMCYLPHDYRGSDEWEPWVSRGAAV